MCCKLSKLKDEDIEDLYTWLYNNTDKSTINDKKQHLISYTLLYYQYKSAKEVSKDLKRNFIIKLLFISSFLQKCEGDL